MKAVALNLMRTREEKEIHTEVLAELKALMGASTTLSQVGHRCHLVLHRVAALTDRCLLLCTPLRINSSSYIPSLCTAVHSYGDCCSISWQQCENLAGCWWAQ